LVLTPFFEPNGFLRKIASNYLGLKFHVVHFFQSIILCVKNN
jgi:hypothetical protein